MAHTIHNVTTREELDSLYAKWALTMEGLALESIPEYVDWLGTHTELPDNLTVYVISGKTMNDNYGLTGTNAYSDDLSLVAVVDINLDALAIPRLEIGGRWFVDIVDNNRRREIKSRYC